MPKCKLVEAGYAAGSCATTLPDGSVKKACEATVRFEKNVWQRVVKSLHLSRPEHYFSIYMSGCNQNCLKCHSAEFTKKLSGKWYTTDELAEICADYENTITYEVPREKALMWYATDICKCCGSCIINGVRSKFCPNILERWQVFLSPQGFGPARNIIAYTGGDLACCIDFYVELTKKIKIMCKKSFILFETNGFALTGENLDMLKDAGLDAFWLDIKAFDEKTYKKLCGVSNKNIINLPAEMKARDFVTEILTLYIPGWVEKDDIVKTAHIIASVDKKMPFTLLAFFPAYKLKSIRKPSLSEMVSTYFAIKDAGLKNVKLGNCHVFAKTENDWLLLEAAVGREAIG